MIKIADYLRLGFSGVVLISKEWREEPGGYQAEHTVHEAACQREDGSYVRVRIDWIEGFGLARGRGHRIESMAPITRTQFTSLRKKHGRLSDKERGGRLRLKESRGSGT